MTVYRFAQCLKNSELLQDRHRSGKPLTIMRNTIKKAFENDPDQGLFWPARNKTDSTSILFISITLCVHQALETIRNQNGIVNSLTVLICAQM